MNAYHLQHKITVKHIKPLDYQVQTILDQISMRLHDDGLPVGASVEEQQRHLWQQLLNTESKLQSATTELQTLRSQQAKEMEEVNTCDSFGFQFKQSLTSILKDSTAQHISEMDIGQWQFLIMVH